MVGGGMARRHVGVVLYVPRPRGDSLRACKSNTWVVWAIHREGSRRPFVVRIPIA